MAKGWETLNRSGVKIGQAAGVVAGAFGKLRNLLPSRYVMVPAALVVWILSGLYTIDSGELGVVQRFGKLDRIAEPGLHYRLPRPIEWVRKCDVEKIRRYDIGLQSETPEAELPYGETAGAPLILTADESLVLADLVVQVRVSSVVDYLYNVEQPEKTVQDAALAALSAVMGQYGFDAALIGDRPGIEEQIGAFLQKLLDHYKSGLQVVAAKLKRVDPPGPVHEAFSEVALAKEQHRQSEAEALKYENEMLPKAKGEAAGMIQAAEAYKLQRVNQAQGDAARFLAQLSAYRQARQVTRKRLYLEAVEEIVSRASKVVVASESQVVWPPLSFENLARPAVSRPNLEQVPK